MLILIIVDREDHHPLVRRAHLAGHCINIGKGVIGLYGDSDLIPRCAPGIVLIRVVMTSLVARIH